MDHKSLSVEPQESRWDLGAPSNRIEYRNHILQVASSTAFNRLKRLESDTNEIPHVKVMDKH